MKEFIKKYLTQRNRNIISIFIIMFELATAFLLFVILITMPYVEYK